MGYRIEVRDRNLRRVGEIDTWIKLDFTVRFSQQGSWMLLIKSGTEQADLLEKGGGVAIFQDGVPEPVLTGQIESFQNYWTVQQHTEGGSLYVGGRCDNKIAYSRLAWPDFDRPISQQYKAPESRSVSGPAGGLIWKELNRSVGGGALPDRRLPGVTTGDTNLIGSQVADSLRFDLIGTKLEEWTAGRDVGYRFVYNPNTRKIDLRIYQPRDLSKKIRFSKDLGNLREFVWTLTAPRVTRVIVACQGDGAERYIYQQVDAEAEYEWGVSIEQFVDRRDLPLKTDPATGLPMKATPDVADADFENAKKAVISAAETVLTEGAKNGNFQIYPIDTPQCTFGRDYFVGDIVTVSIDGTEYTDILREVVISVEDGGKTTSVAPKIGDQGTGNPLNLYKTVFELREKLRRLEARK
ncbi:siphovirus ReqiPepy6 Gp37-like family protein [Kitasatospora sp. NPDC059646]|uniref:siphovirus ReqiPepy6 Gp37-like family protein n=1 Tax=Kitasatospora sp. NPDC059646 TaxID=3346893 RepID=UPI0036C03F12